MAKRKSNPQPGSYPEQDAGPADHTCEARELTNRGARLLNAGRASEAIPALERAFELAPDDVSAAINLGGAYIMAGKQRLAVPLLEKARDMEPDNSMIWINLGAAYLDRPPYMTRVGEEKAIQAFERALELNPAATSVSYNLGLIHKDRGEFKKALEHFQKAIGANPADRDARRWHDALVEQLQEETQEEEVYTPTDEDAPSWRMAGDVGNTL